MLSEGREQMALAQGTGIESPLPQVTAAAVMHAVEEYRYWLWARRNVEAIEWGEDGVTIQ